MPRGRERDSVLRVRRRAKLERDIAAFCTGGGVSIEIARARQRAAVEVLKGYDSGEDLAPDLMDRVRREIVYATEHGGGRRRCRRSQVAEEEGGHYQLAQAPSRHEQQHHQDDYKEQLYQQQPPPPAQPHRANAQGHQADLSQHGPTHSGGDEKKPEAPSERGSVCTPVHSQHGGANAWKPSNIRYGAVSPRALRHDVVMPHRSRGEVDEWAAMIKVQDQLAEQGASEFAAARREAQRAYKHDISQQLEEKRQREAQARKAKEGELLRAKEEVARNHQRQMDERSRQKEEAMRVRAMFEEQKAMRSELLRQERQERYHEECKLLSAAQQQQLAAEAEEAAAKGARRAQMLRMREEVEAQANERQRLKMREREVDRGYAEEYKRIVEQQERRRQAEEARRRERVGKLENMANDNAEVEQRRREEEDRKFLQALAEHEEKAAADERRRREVQQQNKLQYRTFLDMSVEERRRAEQEERDAQQREIAAAARREAEEARAEEDRRRQDKAARQRSYQQELRAQMEDDADKRRHLFRMSDKERALNRQPLDFFVSERGMEPMAPPAIEHARAPVLIAGGGGVETPGQPLHIMHDFSYADAFRAVSQHHKNGRTPQVRGGAWSAAREARGQGGGGAGGGVGMDKYVDNVSLRRGDVVHGGQVVLTHEHEPPRMRVGLDSNAMPERNGREVAVGREYASGGEGRGGVRGGGYADDGMARLHQYDNQYQNQPGYYQNSSNNAQYGHGTHGQYAHIDNGQYGHSNNGQYGHSNNGQYGHSNNGQYQQSNDGQSQHWQYKNQQAGPHGYQPDALAPHHSEGGGGGSYSFAGGMSAVYHGGTGGGGMVGGGGSMYPRGSMGGYGGAGGGEGGWRGPSPQKHSSPLANAARNNFFS